MRKPDGAVIAQRRSVWARPSPGAARRRGLQQALDHLGLPEDLVTEIEGRLRSQHKLLGKIIGVMCPPLFVPYQHRTVSGARLG